MAYIQSYLMIIGFAAYLALSGNDFGQIIWMTVSSSQCNRVKEITVIYCVRRKGL